MVSRVWWALAGRERRRIFAVCVGRRTQAQAGSLKRYIYPKTDYQFLIDLSDDSVPVLRDHKRRENTLRDQFGDGSVLWDAVFLESQIQIAIMFDWVAVGIEQRRVPVSDRLVSLLAVAWELHIATDRV